MIVFAYPLLLNDHFVSPPEVCLLINCHWSYSNLIRLELNLCGSSCHSRGICSNGQCVCSNRTYTGDDCEMCRLSDSINAGCVHLGSDSQPPCMCYLSQSNLRQTPYLCTTMKNDRGETGMMMMILLLHSLRIDGEFSLLVEVPCDRIISSLQRTECSRQLFSNPSCDEQKYSLIYHLASETCLCRERTNQTWTCLNNGLLVLDDNNNSTMCS